VNPIIGLINLLEASRAGQDLTPLARAFLKLLLGFVISAAIAGWEAIQPFLNNQAIDWANVLHTFVAPFATSLLFSVVKYFKAHQDAPLSSGAGTPKPQIVFVQPGEPVPGSPMAQPVPIPFSQRSAANG